MRRSLVIVAALLAVLALPAVAHGWELSKSSNGVIVSRDASDTPGYYASVVVYYDYKGGDDYSASYSPRVATSYRQNVTYSSIFDAFGSIDAVEIPLVPDYRVQFVSVQSSLSSTNKYFVCLNEPIAVREVDPVDSVRVSGSVSATVTAAPPVSLETSPVPVSLSPTASVLATVAGVVSLDATRVSVSADSTLPVSASFAARESEVFVAIAFGVALLCFVAGLALSRVMAK